MISLIKDNKPQEPAVAGRNYRKYLVEKPGILFFEQGNRKATRNAK